MIAENRVRKGLPEEETSEFTHKKKGERSLLGAESQVGHFRQNESKYKSPAGETAVHTWEMRALSFLPLKPRNQGKHPEWGSLANQARSRPQGRLATVPRDKDLIP